MMHGTLPVFRLMASAMQGRRLKIKKVAGSKIDESMRWELIQARRALVSCKGSQDVPLLDLRG
jgi:hypothetical protein